MRHRKNDLIIDDDIKWLRLKVENSAPTDPEKIEGREKLYQRLEQSPKSDQRDVLNEIHNSQIALFSDTSKKVLRLQGDEGIQFRERVRKRRGYVRRCHEQGKTPKKSPLDNIWLPPDSPPHRKKDISFLNLWDLYVALKKARFSPIYENIRNILEYFLNVFITSDSIKRELSRIKKDPYTREYVEFKVRSKKTPKSL